MIDVACAVLVDFDRRILIARRAFDKPLGGLWEFPGGKVETGEETRAALEREIEEELGCRIRVGAPLTAVEHHYAGGPSIRLHPFFCTVVEGTPARREHAALRWIEGSEVESIDWAGADLLIAREVVERLQTARPLSTGSSP